MPLKFMGFQAQKMTEPPRNSRKAFTLVELLSVIAIIAVLVTAASFFTASYIQWAQSVNDQRNFTILNDALTRYKGEGGNVNSLTTTTPISTVLTSLQTAVTWAGMSHQFLNQGFTYPARSIYAKGSGQTYHFTQANTYVSEQGGTSPRDLNATGGGLVSWWKFDEGSGTTAADSTGGNTGSLVNSPTWVAGHNGGALNFSNNGYVSIASNPTVNFGTGQSFSVSFWLNPSSALTTTAGFVAKKASDVAQGYEIYYDNAQGKVNFRIGGNTDFNTWSTVPSANSWTHLVATVSDNGTNKTISLYCNGSLNRTNVSSVLDTTSSAALTVGYAATWGAHFSGLIDDVRIYNRALSATEVSQLYSQ